MDFGFYSGGVQAEVGVRFFLGSLRDKEIRQAEIEHRNRAAAGHQQLIHAAARTAHNGILFQGDQHFVFCGQL